MLLRRVPKGYVTGLSRGQISLDRAKGMGARSLSKGAYVLEGELISNIC